MALKHIRHKLTVSSCMSTIYPIASMYGIFTYLHVHVQQKITHSVDKYTSPMDPNGCPPKRPPKKVRNNKHLVPSDI